MNDLGNLLQMIYDLLSGWFTSFTSHATAVMEKLNLIETDTASIKNSASDIKSNTDDIKDNTRAIVTPLQSIKTNTDSIKNDTTPIKNNVSTMSNQLGTISTNVGTASAFTEDVANNTLDIKDKVVTIASDTTQIRSNTNTVVTDMSKVYEALKWALVDKVTTETEEGDNSVSFDTDLTNDLVSLEVGIEGTQSGTGDPSPDNVRPIIGVTDKSVTVNGNNVTIALGQTIYKGVLDIISGKLTITNYYYEITKVQNKSESAGGYFWYASASYLSIPIIFGLNSELITNRFTIIPNTTTTENDGVITFYANGIIRWKEQGSLSISDYNTYLLSNPVQISYKLLTPIEVQLTPSQIATIKGINTIITDGNISVTYEESVKHYLDKQEV